MFWKYTDFTFAFLPKLMLYEKATQPTKPSIAIAAQLEHQRIAQNIVIYLKE
jgi:hypothetical protein